MTLFDSWHDKPEQVRDKKIKQLISFFGDGILRDGNKTSSELRSFLASVPSAYLARYSKECLESKFDSSGYALQDIINQVGSRLDFEVENGLYQGTAKANNYDGLWTSPEGKSLIVEVKTTDVYGVTLDTIAGYRDKLVNSNEIDIEASSILIVVGREDKRDLDAQIRGSRHAWDTRFISVEYLLKLLDIKEDIDDPQVAVKIRAIFNPQEFTRVDGIVDLLFYAKEDIQEDVHFPGEDEDEPARTERNLTRASFHDACIQKISEKLGHTLLRQTRTVFAAKNEGIVDVNAVSKEYETPKLKRYWFAFHEYQIELLVKAKKKGYVSFGCGSAEKIILIPFTIFQPWLSSMSQSKDRKGNKYWHVHIYDERNKLTLRMKSGNSSNLKRYLLS